MSSALLQGVKPDGEIISLPLTKEGLLKVCACGLDPNGDAIPLMVDELGRVIMAP